MRRHFKWDKKYLYWGITAFCVIACAILFYMVLRYLPALRSGLGTLVKILSPFIWGLVIAYLLTPLVRALEKNVFGGLRKKGGKAKLSPARVLSVVLAELVLLALLVALVYLILPQLYSSIETMVANSPTYANNLNKWATRLFQDYPQIESYTNQALGELNTELSDWIKNTLGAEVRAS